MFCKESFDIELSAWQFFAEALDIDTSSHSFVLIDFLNFVHGFVLKIFGQWDLSLDAAIIVGNTENFTLFKSINNGRIGLKMAHTFERMNYAEGNGKILVAFDFGVKEIIGHKIGV